VISRSSVAACLLAASLGCSRPVDQASIPIGGSGNGGGGAGAGGPVSTCASGTSFLLVDAQNQIYVFDPTSFASKPIGALSCPEIGGSSVVSAALGADGTAYYLLDSQLIVSAGPGPSTTCALWSKVPAPTAEAIAFDGAGGGDEQLVIATDSKVFAANPKTPSSWDVLGSLPIGDTARALLGTGDGRLFAALSPSVEKSFRIARLDLTDATASATVLVPAPLGMPDDPAGFALSGDLLLVFAEKSVVTYSFTTGDVGTKYVVGLGWPIVAVAAPACASTVQP
jgi:hypothetical protein